MTSEARQRRGATRLVAGAAAIALSMGAGFLAGQSTDAGDSTSVSTPSILIPIQPARVLDTRVDAGLAGPFTHNEPRTLDVTGPVDVVQSGGVVATQSPVSDEATAVVLNLTAVGPTSPGFVSIRPGTATGQPTTSNLNITAGVRVVANSVTVALPPFGSQEGAIQVWYSGVAGASTDVLIDIVGYFVPADIPNLREPDFTDSELGQLRWDLDRRSDPRSRSLDSPAGLVFDGDRVWASSTGSGTVIRPGGKYSNGIPAVDVGDNPQRMAFDGTDVWVANFGSDTVSRVGTGSDDRATTFDVGAQPVGVALSSGGWIWVANSGDDTVTKISPFSGEIEATIDVGGRPYGLAADRSNIWVANRDDDTVTRINQASNATTTFPSGGSEPFALASDGQYIWVTHFDSNDVSRIDGNGAQVGSPVAVGTGPREIAYDGADMWVTDNDGLTEINGVTLATNRMDMDGFPVALAFDGDYMWVARFDADDVVKIDP